MGNESRQNNHKTLAAEGWSYLQSSRFDEAEKAYRQAFDLADKEGEREAQSVYLSYLAVACQNQGKYDEARDLLQRCLDIAGSEGLETVECHAHLILGEQNRNEGGSDQAIQHFMRALEISLAAGDEAGIEMAFGNLGVIYLERGWAEQASECFRQALDAANDSPNKAAWLGSLGQSLAELGQLDEAIQYYKQSELAADLHEDPSAKAICLGSHGNALYEKEDFAAAVEKYEKALELSRKGMDAGREGIWLGNIGNTMRKMGQIDRALEYCREALDLSIALGDKHAQAAHLDSIGDCLMEMEDHDRAQEHYRQALLLSRDIKDRQGERIYLSNLGRVSKRLGQLEPAFDFFRKAVDLLDEQRSLIKSDDLKTSFQARGQDLYREIVNVCMDLGLRVEALEYVGRAKSRAILDLLSNSPIDLDELTDTSDTSLSRLIVRESRLRDQIARLERLYWQGGPPSESSHRGIELSAEDTQNIYREWRKTINQLRRRHPNYASLIAVQSLTFKQIRSLWSKQNQKDAILNEDTAILEYFWTDEYFLAAGLWKGVRKPRVHTISDQDSIGRLNRDLADFLEMSATEGWEVPKTISNRLYQHLVKPIVDELPKKIKRIILIPHASLYRLPFAALNDGTIYLAERFAISYLPTSSLIPVLAAARQKGRKDNSYLVTAISDYSATREHGLSLTAHLRSAAGLEDLSYTMEEASTVLKTGSVHSPDAKLITNHEVKEALPDLFGQYPVVHFAGHAVFNPQEPLASGLVLSDGSILTAASILQGNQLRTNCGRLLVLSACQTGVNMVTQGGEILGLARALMYAGMPNLILSLWEVADRSTASLMHDFHDAWQGGKTSISEALQHAQKKAIAAGQPIHAWAPFIHLGIE